MIWTIIQRQFLRKILLNKILTLRHLIMVDDNPSNNYQLVIAIQLISTDLRKTITQPSTRFNNHSVAQL